MSRRGRSRRAAHLAARDSHVRTLVSLALSASPFTLVGLVVLTLVGGLSPAASASAAKAFVDAVGDQATAGELAPVGLAVGALLVAGYVLPACSNFLSQRLDRSMRYEVNRRLFEKIGADVGIARLERPEHQDRIEFACYAGEAAPQQVLSGGLTVGQSVISAISLLGLIASVEPLAALVALVGAGPLLLAELHLSRRRVQVMETRSALDRRRGFYRALLMQPQAAKELRLFGLGGFFRDRMLADLRTGNELERGLDRTTLKVQTALAGLAGLLAFGCIAMAVRAVAAGQLTPGELTAFLAAFTGLTGAFSGIVNQAIQLREGIVLLDRFADLVTEPEPELDAPPPRGAAVGRLQQGIGFEDVWFRYGSRLPWVLQGVDLALPADTSVALVGVNGAGKSTLVKLLGGAYTPTSGRITIDGHDLAELDLEALRERIAAVFQDYMCYDLTARENVAVGDLRRMGDPAAVRWAAMTAGIHDDIEALPAGYQTMLSRIMWGAFADEEAAKTNVVLSGGQWQRLALARMFFRGDRDLVILDEPSAGLDAEAEHAVHETVHRYLHGRVRLLISHRLAAVRAADTICVLDGGRIAETGTHDQLMTTGGRYAELFTLQASGYQDDRVDHLDDLDHQPLGEPFLPARLA
jgi:ATP-binding cassette subfamily B protein